MKKMLLSFMILLLMFGCSSPSKDKVEDDPIVQQDNNTPVTNQIDVVRTKITDAGYTIEEEVVMAADLVGGISGTKFITSEGNLEVYLFDVESDAYKNAVENGVITLEGFGDFPAVVVDEYVYFGEDVLIDLIK